MKNWTLFSKRAPKIYVWSNVSLAVLGRKSAISLKVVLNTSGGGYFQKIWVPNLGTISNTFPDLNHREMWKSSLVFSTILARSFLFSLSEFFWKILALSSTSRNLELWKQQRILNKRNSKPFKSGEKKLFIFISILFEDLERGTKDLLVFWLRVTKFRNPKNDFFVVVVAVVVVVVGDFHFSNSD